MISCPKCGKPLAPKRVCVCDLIAEPIPNRIFTLILQHPQEKQEILGTATLLQTALENSLVKIGLSWRSLSHALGEEANPKEWVTLYLGSKSLSPQQAGGHSIFKVNSKTKNLSPFKPEGPVKGLIVLDGTWSQAKTLWWRNAWLLKTTRISLAPPKKSLYAHLRKEPRKECLSTLESVAMALDQLGENPVVGSQLVKLFTEMLERYSRRKT